MSTKFFTSLTEIGADKLANATALGVPLKITEMAVGDGGGTLPTPNIQQTKLIGEKRRAALNQLYIDPLNSKQIIAEQVIPENEGGWWIREVGLFDESGALIAVGNCAESYKPLLTEGSGRTQTVRMILNTSGTDNITLTIDPSVVLATREYVDSKLGAKQPLDKTLTDLSGKDVAEILDYLGLKGTPSGGFPIGMPFFWPSSKMPNELLPEWSGMEFLKWNGASFSASKYPKLALVIPSLTLVEARGEFPRIWDDGRGVDSGRGLLSVQEDAIRNLKGSIGGIQFAESRVSVKDGNLLASETLQASGAYKTNLDSEVSTKGQGVFRLKFDASTTVPTAAENRPRNIAFNFLVRAK